MPTAEQIAEWERDQHLQGNPGRLARLALIGVAHDREQRSRPPEAIPEPPALPAKPATEPPPPTPKGSPLNRREFLAPIRRLVAALANSARREWAVEELYRHVARGFGERRPDTPERWRARFGYLGATENGRARLREMIESAARRDIRARETYLTTCLDNEPGALCAQNPAPGATRQSPPGGRSRTGRARDGQLYKECVP